MAGGVSSDSSGGGTGRLRRYLRALNRLDAAGLLHHELYHELGPASSSQPVSASPWLWQRNLRDPLEGIFWRQSFRAAVARLVKKSGPRIM